MLKRYRILCVILILCMGLLGVRVFFIAYFHSSSAAAYSGGRVEYYGTERGFIFDRNMQKMVENESKTVNSVNYPSFCFRVPKRYAEKQLCEHFIGYTNAENTGVSGIEKDYDTFLKSIDNQILVKSYRDARGNALLGKGAQLDTSRACTNSGVVLTIDSRIQKICEEASQSLKQGAVIVMNSASGEILANVSYPRFRPSEPAAALKEAGEPLINRSLMAYNVGSVFKVIVCLAALEAGITPDFSYRCTGSVMCGSVLFHCHKADGHGKIGMKQALAFSCNTYFIELARKLGAKPILSLCERLGLQKKIVLSDSIQSAAGNLPDEKNVSSVAALANLSFGQGELLASPLWLCSVYACIQNGGYLPQLSLVKGTVREGNMKSTNSLKKQILKEKNASCVREMLEYAVKAGTGKGAYSEKCAIGGKTATAQTGTYIGKKEKLISYFIGFYTIKSDKYTVLIMCENGSSGSEDCVPVFKKIFEAVYTLEPDKVN